MKHGLPSRIQPSSCSMTPPVPSSKTQPLPGIQPFFFPSRTAQLCSVAIRMSAASQSVYHQFSGPCHYPGQQPCMPDSTSSYCRPPLRWSTATTLLIISQHGMARPNFSCSYASKSVPLSLSQACRTDPSCWALPTSTWVTQISTASLFARTSTQKSYALASSRSQHWSLCSFAPATVISCMQFLSISTRCWRVPTASLSPPVSSNIISEWWNLRIFLPRNSRMQ